MNLQSEIAYYTRDSDCGQGAADGEFPVRAHRRGAGHLRRHAQDSVHDAARLRFTNEMCNRITKLIEQYLGDDKARPADDVVLRMLLSPRADKVAEKMMHAAYRRALQNFERYDTTVFMNS